MLFLVLFVLFPLLASLATIAIITSLRIPGMTKSECAILSSIPPGLLAIIAVIDRGNRCDVWLLLLICSVVWLIANVFITMLLWRRDAYRHR